MMILLPVRYVYFIMRAVVKNYPAYNARYVGKYEKTGKTDLLCSPWSVLQGTSMCNSFSS